MSPGEHVFARDDLVAVGHLPDRDGLLAARGPTGANGKPRRLEFQAVPQAVAARGASGIAQLGCVAYVAIHGRIHPPAETEVALTVAGHLWETRSRAGLDPAIVTSPTPPQLRDADRLVRVPHLITTAFGPDGNGDQAVIWEVMRAGQYKAWLGGARAPDSEQIEAHLPALLCLRQLHRDGRLDLLPDAGPLHGLLDGRYLSARITYRHPDIVLPAAREAAACFSEEG